MPGRASECRSGACPQRRARRTGSSAPPRAEPQVYRASGAWRGSSTGRSSNGGSQARPSARRTLRNVRLHLERIAAFKNYVNHLGYDLIAANADCDRGARILWRAGSASRRVCCESGQAGHRYGHSPAAVPGHRRHHDLRRVLGNQRRGLSIEEVIGLSMSLGSVSPGSAGASYIGVGIGAVSGETRFAISPLI
jgi:hypothetical protein